ncbi:FAD-dependent monooxygenase [Streptomyces triculaminicus]|uniref:FAD-dependent monooxygenase n=1 Tax=Streptomyces triculaminicus TaxID=2816232 RepID=UPI0033DD08CA
MSMDTDILIAGAGPTGLVLAIDLARRGIPHRVVERSERGFPGSRGTGIQPRTLELFDDLGVIDAIMAGSGPVPTVQTWEGAERSEKWNLTESADASPAIPYPAARMLPQWRTVEILYARLEELGGRVDFSAELAGFTQDPDGVTGTLRHADGTEETVRAKWLVAADGGRSEVRQALGIPFTGEQVDPRPVLIADVLLEGPDRARIDGGHWHMWQKEERGFVALRPLEQVETVQVIAGFADDGKDIDLDTEATPEALGRLVAERTRLDLTISEVRWASAYRARMAMAERFRSGRVLLAGDAAHVHSPAGGQGLNTSVQDAYNLGWKLEAVLRRGAPDALIDSYDTERTRIAADVLGLSTRVHKADVGNGGGRWRRGKETHQLTLGYREGPLTRELRRDVPEDALRAGDRAPDAPCQDASGAPVRLFDVFRGPHFTLLDLTGQADDEQSAPELPDWVRTFRPQDPEGHAKAAYGSGLFLVRPDGYVGLATDDVRDVAAYVGSVTETE